MKNQVISNLWRSGAGKPRTDENPEQQNQVWGVDD